MQAKQSGFTLIELVVVIVILGILSAVALPKFIDLSGQAAAAAAQGVAGSVSSAASINYAARKAGNGSAAAVQNCTAAGGLLVGGMPTNFTIAATACAGSPTADGVTVSCLVTSTQTTPNQTASATVICVP